MTRSLAASLPILLLLGAAPLAAQDLQPGAKAPGLSVAKWLKGEPVAAFAAGHVYVVTWWATWSEESLAGFERLAALQKQHAKAMTVVAVTTGDVANPLEHVEQVVGDLGDRMPFRCAWDDEKKSLTTWVRAAGVEGFPVCFVVDGAGTIAWLGDPKWLDVLLPDVLAGKAEPAALAGKVEAIEKRMMRIFLAAALKPEVALQESADLLKEHPFLTEQVEFGLFSLLLEGEGCRHAWPIGERLVARAAAAGDAWTLNGIAWAIVDPDEERAERNLELAKKAAEKAVALTGQKDGSMLDTLARVLAWQGDRAGAVELQKKAIQASIDAEDDEDTVAGLRATLTQYEKKLAEGGK